MTANAGNRRQADRRQTDTPQETIGPDTRAADSRFFSREEAEGEAAGGGALVRVARIYAAARAVIGVALVLAQAAATQSGQAGFGLVTFLCVAYMAQAMVVWLLPRFRALTETLALPRQGRQHGRWMATIGVDVLVFVLLHLLDRTTNFNFAALLVLPVLMTGVLMPRMVALGTAATVALLLLAGAWQTVLSDSDPTAAMTRAGLAGIGFFVITLLAGELSARLVREETSARDSMELARRQAQLNRLVIQEMSDGVLVIDRGLRVRAANPAGRGLLVTQGVGPKAPFDLTERRAWQSLAMAARQALEQGLWPAEGREIDLAFEDGHIRAVRLRVRFTHAPGTDLRSDRTPDPYCVLLLEDLRTAQARLRQEKLAAMGRVSAGIAHEIRNPLAAISQANALMLEDELRPDQQRLARMVADNVRRLQRIVDEVTELAPADMTALPQVIDARAVVAAAAVDWAQTAGLEFGSASRLHTDLPEVPVGASFDPEHLRRVLVNLLDNALRHASAEAGSVLLQLAVRDEGQVVLQVISDGAAIPPEVERLLFEPFFSTRSRGSGLGLYICRELCERYGASIEYRPRPGAKRLRNEFVVTMRRAALNTADAVLPLSP